MTIRFLKLDHWRGVFVEPMSINVRDLIAFLESNGAANRSLVIRAAATDVCAEPTIKVSHHSTALTISITLTHSLSLITLSLIH